MIDTQREGDCRHARYRQPDNTAGKQEGSSMSSGNILFEQTYKGDNWRLKISTCQGWQRGNWRKWHRAKDEWRPSREGCTIPLERLPDQARDLAAYVATIAPSGPEIGY
ncbi:hypothetical protein G7A66_09595 [Altererythrobacter sp. SALINAS58]|uniref:hypothetical protein n=1 Tax=Alteripontixanthobacter muriae TaxID=2705546 RepID=UPI0015759156|nr:hypothetical protein [Alteripontixanthobacter muriae]NTZ43332.1 hypothetical protein [Alteripontixanthobacter muriae]